MNIFQKYAFSFKDILAMFVGYVVTSFLIGSMMVVITILRDGDAFREDVFLSYEIPVALVTCGLATIGGIVLGFMHRANALRNAVLLVIFLAILALFTLLRDGGPWMFAFVAFAQVAIGIVIGGFIVHRNTQ